ncbi:hypothetical protein H9P43_009480 [Blastocladiella emersonii ATCC 22665]|nr:hypothetical protein H9P43_009480 [Blastocladiella emersonii ATCC 22665]
MNAPTTSYCTATSIRRTVAHWLAPLCYVAMLLSLFAQTVVALPASDPPVGLPSAASVSASANKLLADEIALAVVFIATGLLACFFGGKLFRVCMFIAGAYLFALVAFSVLQRVEPAAGFGNRQLVYLAVGIAAAVIGGFLLTFFYKLGMFALGAFGGYTLALFILTLKTGGLISGSTVQAVFIAICAILGGIAVFFVEPHVVRLGTAFGGSYVTFLGLDLFAKTGFADAAKEFMGHPTLKPEATAGVYGMAAGVVVLAIIGAMSQYRYTSKHYTGYKSIGGKK